jgi:hypothetical protein
MLNEVDEDASDDDEELTVVRTVNDSNYQYKSLNSY